MAGSWRAKVAEVERKLDSEREWTRVYREVAERRLGIIENLSNDLIALRKDRDQWKAKADSWLGQDQDTIQELTKKVRRLESGEELESLRAQVEQYKYLATRLQGEKDAMVWEIRRVIGENDNWIDLPDD